MKSPVDVGWRTVAAATLLTGVFLAWPVAAQDTRKDANTAVESLINEFWTWRLTEAPEYAYKFGVSAPVEGVVEDFSETAFLRRKTRAEEFLQKAGEISDELLDQQNTISLAILKDLLQTFLDGFEFRKISAYNPVSPLGGPFLDWKSLINWFKLDSVSDYERLLELYKKLPRQIEQRISLMDQAISLGTTSHAASLTGVIERLDNEVIDNPRDSRFYQIFLSRLETLPVATRGRILSTAEDSVRRIVIPTWRRFRDYLNNTYLPNTRSEIGASSLPNGPAYYKQCLRWHLSLDVEPAYVYQVGVKEVERIQKLMEEIKEEEGFNGDLRSYLVDLKTRPENVYTSEREIMDACKATVKTAQGNLSQVLGNVPKAKVEVRLLDNPQGPTGRYSEPPLDESRPGIFWVKAVTPSAKLGFPALALHEAVPGHHTQAAYAIEQSIPFFRRAVEYRHYSSVPFNWAFHTAYSEGWGLYAEFMGEDMGIYQDNLSLFGRYSSEIFRAARLVIDTGIHHFGHSKAWAKEYMSNYTLLSDGMIESEINRYISWPGQATAYKIGEMKIKDLRKKAENTLKCFDQRDFHDKVLMLGPAPLSILEEYIDDWIEEEKQKEADGEVTCKTSSSTTNISNFVVIILCVFALLLYV